MGNSLLIFSFFFFFKKKEKTNVSSPNLADSLPELLAPYLATRAYSAKAFSTVGDRSPPRRCRLPRHPYPPLPLFHFFLSLPPQSPLPRPIAGLCSFWISSCYLLWMRVWEWRWGFSTRMTLFYFFRGNGRPLVVVVVVVSMICDIYVSVVVVLKFCL